jgi:hypothetical protein
MYKFEHWIVMNYCGHECGLMCCQRIFLDLSEYPNIMSACEFVQQVVWYHVSLCICPTSSPISCHLVNLSNNKRGLIFCLFSRQRLLLNLFNSEHNLGVHGGAVGWGTVLQGGRLRVRFPVVSLEFFVDIILPAALWPWGWLGLWRKWVPGIFPVG